MPAKLIVRVLADDRVEVSVDGLTAKDTSRPPRQKLCERVTARLERDLGAVTQRTYRGEADGADAPITTSDSIELKE